MAKSHKLPRSSRHIYIKMPPTFKAFFSSKLSRQCSKRCLRQSPPDRPLLTDLREPAPHGGQEMRRRHTWATSAWEVCPEGGIQIDHQGSITDIPYLAATHGELTENLLGSVANLSEYRPCQLFSSQVINRGRIDQMGVGVWPVVNHRRDGAVPIIATLLAILPNLPRLD